LQCAESELREDRSIAGRSEAALRRLKHSAQESESVGLAFGAEAVLRQRLRKVVAPGRVGQEGHGPKAFHDARVVSGQAIGLYGGRDNGPSHSGWIDLRLCHKRDHARPRLGLR